MLDAIIAQVLRERIPARLRLTESDAIFLELLNACPAPYRFTSWDGDSFAEFRGIANNGKPWLILVRIIPCAST